jgi:hypothetical protein
MGLVDSVAVRDRSGRPDSPTSAFLFRSDKWPRDGQLRFDLYERRRSVCHSLREFLWVLANSHTEWNIVPDHGATALCLAMVSTAGSSAYENVLEWKLRCGDVGRKFERTRFHREQRNDLLRIDKRQ